METYTYSVCEESRFSQFRLLSLVRFSFVPTSRLTSGNRNGFNWHSMTELGGVKAGLVCTNNGDKCKPVRKSIWHTCASCNETT